MAALRACGPCASLRSASAAGLRRLRPPLLAACVHRCAMPAPPELYFSSPPLTFGIYRCIISVYTEQGGIRHENTVTVGRQQEV